MNKEIFPEKFKYIGDVMSNFDNKIEYNSENKLKSGHFYGSYPAWNFYGRVWFDKIFKCEIQVYKNHVETITGETLKEIMKKSSDKYGYE